jgi:hypothetical protein
MVIGNVISDILLDIILDIIYGSSRYRGVKQQVLAEQLYPTSTNKLALPATVTPEKKTFDELRQIGIENHKLDGGYLTAARLEQYKASHTVTKKTAMKEIFTIAGDLLYDRQAFIAEYGHEGEQLGKRWESHQLTPSISVGGFRVEDHGRRPLARGVTQITKQIEKDLRICFLYIFSMYV